MPKVKDLIAKGGRFCDIECGLIPIHKQWSWYDFDGSIRTFSNGSTKESKYQNKKSSSNSRRFKESETDTLVCLITWAVAGANQSHAEVLKCCRTRWRVKVSYRRQAMNILTSTNMSESGWYNLTARYISRPSWGLPLSPKMTLGLLLLSPELHSGKPVV